MHIKCFQKELQPVDNPHYFSHQSVFSKIYSLISKGIIVYRLKEKTYYVEIAKLGSAMSSSIWVFIVRNICCYLNTIIRISIKSFRRLINPHHFSFFLSFLFSTLKFVFIKFTYSYIWQGLRNFDKVQYKIVISEFV